MVVERENFLEKIARIKTGRNGERRAPHKPLLILFAISEILRGNRVLDFTAVEEMLTPLLNAYAPPVVGKHQPELPYWHLMSDGFWQIDDFGAAEKKNYPKREIKKLINFSP
jgi:putative restriction endonuclease